MSRFHQVDKTEIRNPGFCVENCKIIRLEWTRRDGCQQAGGHCARRAAGYRRQLGECLGGRHESDTQRDGRRSSGISRTVLGNFLVVALLTHPTPPLNLLESPTFRRPSNNFRTLADEALYYSIIYPKGAQQLDQQWINSG